MNTRPRRLVPALSFTILALAGCHATPRAPAEASPFGAGDGKTLCTAAIQRALDRCAAAGGGEVVIPAGRFLTGSLRLGSNTTLRLAAGATLVGSADPADYPIAPIRFEGEAVPGHRALVWADGAANVAIVGPGTLQGDEQIGDLRSPRAPTMVEFENCSHVRLDGFADRYRRMWSIHLLFCDDVVARDLNLRTTRANGDGIDVDSSTNVTIERCDVDAGDDAISLKSGRGAQAARDARPTRDVTIRDCTLGSAFAGVGIGTEMSGGVRDVRIERCTFPRGSNAIFLKSRAGRGGAIERVAVVDAVTSAKTFLGINLVNKGLVGTEPIAGADGLPLVRDVTIDRVAIRGGTLLDGANTSPDRPIDGLSLSHVSGTCARGITLANATRVRFADIDVRGFNGPLVTTRNVAGTGLDTTSTTPTTTTTLTTPTTRSTIAALRDAFASPPDDARPMVRWWWFGPAVTRDELRREIAQMRAGGFGGFEVQPTYPLAVDGPGGVANLTLMSPPFLDALAFAAAEARSAGLRMDLTLGSGWPYGGPNFPIAEAAGRLRLATAPVPAGGSAVAVPALRDGESLVAAFADGVEARVENGEARLPAAATTTRPVQFFIAGHTGMKVKRPAIGGEGFVIDHDDPAVVRKFLDTVGAPAVAACGPNVPFAIFCDSLEVGGEDWTRNFLAEFRRRRGYDLRPHLPALVDGADPAAAEVRHDWGRTLSELFDDAFVAPLARFAKDRGTRLRMQAYGSPSAGLFSYANVDLPEGEGYQWHDYRATRYASSASHLMGRPVTSSETFTWLHPPVFRATPLDVKAEADLHFLQGVNQVICHGWPYTPPGVADPGWSFYAAAVFDERNPWYGVMPDVTRYLARVSALLRQGRPANDVALYLADDDAWARFAPGRISLSDGVGAQLGRRIVGQVLDAGYGLDFFDDPMLDRFGRVDGGRLAFGDVGYRVVVLAGVERVPVATMRKLEAFARGGGIVVATRRMPDRAPGFTATDEERREVRAIAGRLFVGATAPGLFVEDESTFGHALAARLQPDVALAPAAPQVGFVHRRVGDADVYFLANTSNAPVATRATFRVEARTAQRWDPLTGEAAALAPAVDGATVPIRLDPYESTVIVFAPGDAPATRPASSSGDAQAIDLSAGWQVQFGPTAAPTTMPALRSWTDDASTRAFSGVATYTRAFDLPDAPLAAGATAWLDFGPGVARPAPPADAPPGSGFAAMIDAPVRDAAIVYVNGRRAGSVWCPPYRLDVARWLTPGHNAIRVDVANTAVNAIAARGFPNYDVAAITRQFGSRFNPPAADAFRPVPSGLIGPVTLRVTR